jgi:hypothetical protein
MCVSRVGEHVRNVWSSPLRSPLSIVFSYVSDTNRSWYPGRDGRPARTFCAHERFRAAVNSATAGAHYQIVVSAQLRTIQDTDNKIRNRNDTCMICSSLKSALDLNLLGCFWLLVGIDSDGEEEREEK